MFKCLQRILVISCRIYYRNINVNSFENFETLPIRERYVRQNDVNASNAITRAIFNGLINSLNHMHHLVMA